MHACMGMQQMQSYTTPVASAAALDISGLLTYCTQILSRRTSSRYRCRLLSALVAASRACVSSLLLACVLYCSCVHLMNLMQ